MLEETGMVVSVSSNQAKVAMVRSEACGNCPSKGVCHPTSEGFREMEVANPMGAKPGEKVVITLAPEVLLKATTLAYLFPATLMVVGATLGWSLKGTDMGALFGALAGLTVSSLYIYLHGKMKKAPQGPAISKVLDKEIITQDQF
jgi:positive regulator of sigma E activity